MTLKDIIPENVERFEKILVEANLNTTINKDWSNIPISLKTNSLSNYNDKDNFMETRFGKMQVRYFLYDSSRLPLKIDYKSVELYVNVGPWAYKAREEGGIHICLGCRQYGERFSQLEISDCIQDDKYIYLVKKLNRLAGKGSIMRINKGGQTRNEKLQRREFLRERLGFEVVDDGDIEWLVIYKVNFKDLSDKEQQDRIITEFYRNFLFYSFTIEEIIKERDR